jgi:hypothetical protein
VNHQLPLHRLRSSRVRRHWCVRIYAHRVLTLFDELPDARDLLTS